MAAKQEILIVTARQEDLPAERIRGGLNRVKRSATCQFCSDKVWINSSNLAEQVGKGYTPVLICAKCYGEGAHIRQGFQGVNT